jgi:hypothetical protein
MVADHRRIALESRVCGRALLKRDSNTVPAPTWHERLGGFDRLSTRRALSQLELLNLPGGCFWKFGNDLDPLRDLE